MDYYGDDIVFVDTTDEEIINILINNIEFVEDRPFQERLLQILIKIQNK